MDTSCKIKVSKNVILCFNMYLKTLSYFKDTVLFTDNIKSWSTHSGLKSREKCGLKDWYMHFWNLYSNTFFLWSTPFSSSRYLQSYTAFNVVWKNNNVFVCTCKYISHHSTDFICLCPKHGPTGFLISRRVVISDVMTCTNLSSLLSTIT